MRCRGCRASRPVTESAWRHLEQGRALAWRRIWLWAGLGLVLRLTLVPCPSQATRLALVPCPGHMLCLGLSSCQMRAVRSAAIFTRRYPPDKMQEKIATICKKRTGFERSVLQNVAIFSCKMYTADGAAGGTGESPDGGAAANATRKRAPTRAASIRRRVQ